MSDPNEPNDRDEDEFILEQGAQDSVPPESMAPESQPALSKRSRVAQGLQTLFSASDVNPDQEPVPGASDSLLPPSPEAIPDIQTLAEDLAAMARDQSSALAKSRGLLVASQLWSHVGSVDEAYEAARQSAETSPKLGLSALVLRKKAMARGDDESVHRSLEAAARLASHPSSRAHAIRLLVEHLNDQEREAEIAKVLDQAARSGDADDALLLQRLIHRLGQGVSLAGVDIPNALAGGVADAQEILGTTVGTPDAEGRAQELNGVRSARALADKELANAVDELRKTSVPDEAIDELHAAALGAEPGNEERAAQLLKALVAGTPAKRHLRRLATLAVQTGDQATLLNILDRSDPGTFSLEERFVLSACSGQRLEVSQEDMIGIGRENPALGIALGPSELPAPEVDAASSPALLAQIGSGLNRLSQPDSAEAFSAPALEALAELKARGATPQLRASLELLAAQLSGNDQLFAESLMELSEEPERASGQLIAGALFQKEGRSEDSERGYRGALEGDDALASSASYGLVDVGAEDGLDLLRTATDRTEDHHLAFAQKLGAALRGDVEERASQVLDAVSALHDTASGTPKEDGTSSAHEAALLLAAGSLVAQQGNSDRAQESRTPLLQSETRAGILSRLRLEWDGEQVQPVGSDQRDSSERMLAYFRGSPSPLQLPEPDSEDRTLVHPASEMLLHLARRIANEDLDESARLGMLVSEVDRSAEAIGVDLQKLSGNTDQLSPLWLDRSKSAATAESRRFAYERLAELDELKGDRSSALLWNRTLAEEFPDHLPSLLRFEENLLVEGKSTNQATERLAEALPGQDGQTYQLLFGAKALSQSDLRGARKHLEPLLSEETTPLLALRGLVTIGHEKREDELLLRCYTKLAETAGTDLDRCSLALSVALILARLDRKEEATDWTKKAIEAKSGSFAAHQLLSYLSTPDDALERAQQLEAFALTATVAQHRTQLFFEAGQVFDEAKDPERAADCYEQTLTASPDHREAFALLCERRESGGALEQVEQLIISRLALIAPGTSEHLDLELRVAGLLAAQDKAEQAKTHLEEALASHPGHTGALRAHADVSAQLGAHEAAEKSLLALKDQIKTGDERVEVIRSLARLYDQHLSQTEKAMDSYQEVLQLNPEDERTREDLVRIYSQLGLAERATTMQTKIIQSTGSAEQKRDGALKLAEIYEKVAGDPKRAGATLERTRKAWPLDGAVLEATVQFMDRQGTGGPRGFLLDRAGKDARRKLETGKLDGGLLDTLSRVARLSGHNAQAESTEAARNAYIGTAGELLKGAGLGALDPKLDELLAPRGLPAPLRTLLRKTGAAMDAAFSLDLANMGARQLTEGPTFERIAQIAQALGSDAPALFVSDKLGAKCLPVTTEPARLLVGSSLDQLPERERDYLILRALKLRWLGAGALARSSDKDRWPMLAALLHLFAPNWRPRNVDGRKAAQAKTRIEQGLARVGYDDDVPMLALEVIGALGEQTANVGDLPRVLANRVALLGIGDPGTILSAMAQSEGAKLASGGPSRFRWIEAHSEAKDLLLFATTEKCAKARQALGLAEASPAAAPPARPGGGPPSRKPGAPTAPRPGGRPAPPRRPKPPPPKR